MSIWQKLNIDFANRIDKVCYRNGVTGRGMTYGDIFATGSCLAKNIFRGFKTSSGVSVLLIKNPDLLLPIIVGCWKSGILPAVLAPDMPWDKFELINEVIKADFVLTDLELDSSFAKFPIKRITAADILSAGERPVDIFSAGNIADSQPAILMFSSGTTGIPKCIPWTLRHLTSNIKSFNSLLNITSSDVFLCTSPPWYSHGLYNSILTAFFMGAEAVVMDILNLMNTDKTLRAALKYGATVYHTTPSMLPLLSIIGSRADYELPHFRYIIAGTAKLTAEVKDKFESVFKQVLTQQYGMVETLFMAVNHKRQKELPLSVGEPLAKGLLEAVDIDGKTVPTGQEGEIRIKITSEYGEYYSQPAETANVYRGGYFYTGDIGVFDTASYLTITGRKKEIIKKGGFNINPHEINAVIGKFPGIKEVVTIGVKDELYGEEIYSFVTFSGDFSSRDIIDFCTDKLQHNHIPKQIFKIDTFPITTSGKVSLTELGKIAEELIKN